MTGVKEGNNTRLLLTKNKWDTLSYIASLEKYSEIAQFFKRYPDLLNTFIRWDLDLVGVEVLVA